MKIFWPTRHSEPWLYSTTTKLYTVEPRYNESSVYRSLSYNEDFPHSSKSKIYEKESIKRDLVIANVFCHLALRFIEVPQNLPRLINGLCPSAGYGRPRFLVGHYRPTAFPLLQPLNACS